MEVRAGTRGAGPTRAVEAGGVVRVIRSGGDAGGSGGGGGGGGGNLRLVGAGERRLPGFRSRDPVYPIPQDPPVLLPGVPVAPTVPGTVPGAGGGGTATITATASTGVVPNIPGGSSSHVAGYLGNSNAAVSAAAWTPISSSPVVVTSLKAAAASGGGKGGVKGLAGLFGDDEQSKALARQALAVFGSVPPGTLTSLTPDQVAQLRERFKGTGLYWNRLFVALKEKYPALWQITLTDHRGKRIDNPLRLLEDALWDHHPLSPYRGRHYARKAYGNAVSPAEREKDRANGAELYQKVLAVGVTEDELAPYFFLEERAPGGGKMAIIAPVLGAALQLVPGVGTAAALGLNAALGLKSGASLGDVLMNTAIGAASAFLPGTAFGSTMAGRALINAASSLASGGSAAQALLSAAGVLADVRGDGPAAEVVRRLGSAVVQSAQAAAGGGLGGFFDDILPVIGQVIQGQAQQSSNPIVRQVLSAAGQLVEAHAHQGGVNGGNILAMIAGALPGLFGEGTPAREVAQTVATTIGVALQQTSPEPPPAPSSLPPPPPPTPIAPTGPVPPGETAAETLIRVGDRLKSAQGASTSIAALNWMGGYFRGVGRGGGDARAMLLTVWDLIHRNAPSHSNQAAATAAAEWAENLKQTVYALDGSGQSRNVPEVLRVASLHTYRTTSNPVTREIAAAIHGQVTDRVLTMAPAPMVQTPPPGQPGPTIVSAGGASTQGKGGAALLIAGVAGVAALAMLAKR